MIATPTNLDVLLAEFERSQVGELKLRGTQFELHLRRGRKPRWKLRGEQAAGDPK